MNLATETATASSSFHLFRDSALGHASLPRILEVIAHRIRADHVSVEVLVPIQASHSGRKVIPLHASQNFIRRWREMHGDIAAGVGRALTEVSERVPAVQDINAGSIRLDAIAGHTDYCLGIDSEDGFYGLSVRGGHRDLQEILASDCLTDCLGALSYAANTAVAIRRAQQKLLLELLDSGGAAAMVLDTKGWVKSGNTTAHKLLGNILHLPERSLDASLRSTGENADESLLLERARIKQWPFTTPSGQQLMVYATPWKREDVNFRSGDELLVAWDTSLDAPLLNGFSVADYAAMSHALRQTFGLTKTESALATHLIGSDLRGAAKQCGMAYETARSHLKSIFARMKIRRQGELVALLSRFAYHERLRQTLSTT